MQMKSGMGGVFLAVISTETHSRRVCSMNNGKICIHSESGLTLTLQGSSGGAVRWQALKWNLSNDDHLTRRVSGHKNRLILNACGLKHRIN